MEQSKFGDFGFETGYEWWEELDEKRKCLVAMALALGKSKDEARQNLEESFSRASELGDIDCYAKPGDFDDKTKNEIRQIGALFLPKDDHLKRLAVGLWVIRIINENISEFMLTDLQNNLRVWSYMGQGAEQFAKIIKYGPADNQ
jgi:hypothetical protein